MSSDNSKPNEYEVTNIPSSLTANYVIETYTYFVSNLNSLLKQNQDGGGGGNNIGDSSDYDDLSSPSPLHVQIQSATTTVGGPIVVADEYDATGIMIWPATHLLCQYLCSTLMTTTLHNTPTSATTTTAVQPSTASNLPTTKNQYLFSQHHLGNTVLELGCGCGLVGITAALLSVQEQASISEVPRCQKRLWVSTDMDCQSLRLASANLQLNQILFSTRSDTHTETNLTTELDNSSLCVWIRRLQWGHKVHIHQLLHELSEWRKLNATADNSINQSEEANGFESIVAADIVYPATCGQVLHDLFTTVDQLLAPGGTFWLSFCSRDGPKTPVQLIDVASDAGFHIQAMPPLPDNVLSQLPPLLDAKLLIFQRSDMARLLNQSLGQNDHCPVFPGLRAAMSRREASMAQNEIEIWRAPFSSDEDEQAES